jgi:hypothetical protein
VQTDPRAGDPEAGGRQAERAQALRQAGRPDDNPYIFASFIDLPVFACALSDDVDSSFMARCNRAFAVL